jgi:hypothetical protein
MKARLYSSQIVSIGAPSARTHNQSIQFLDQLAAALPQTRAIKARILFISKTGARNIPSAAAKGDALWRFDKHVGLCVCVCALLN